MTNPHPGQWPDEMDVLAYASLRLAEPEARRLQAHLFTCAWCRLQLDLALEAAADAAEAAQPQWLGALRRVAEAGLAAILPLPGAAAEAWAFRAAAASSDPARLPGAFLGSIALPGGAVHLSLETGPAGERVLWLKADAGPLTFTPHGGRPTDVRLDEAGEGTVPLQGSGLYWLERQGHRAPLVLIAPEEARPWIKDEAEAAAAAGDAARAAALRASLRHLPHGAGDLRSLPLWRTLQRALSPR